MSCGYNRNTQKWDVKFNNGKTYSYAYLNVEKLTDPEVLNPNMYRISREKLLVKIICGRSHTMYWLSIRLY